LLCISRTSLAVRRRTENREGQCFSRTSPGQPALGIFAEGTYQQWTRPLQGGELYVLFTDGVHEAYNETGDEFGLDRVRDTIRRQLSYADADVPAAIVSEVQHFIAPAAPRMIFASWRSR
jgi:serine phosphatase RsbU (regulator of sigma subunit)